MRVIGLTGGIASGKSSVAAIMAEEGIPVIDADLLAREAVLPGSVALQQIAATFGSAVIAPDGTLDRGALAGFVFSDESARRKLESILHPAIKSLAEQRLQELRDCGAPVAVYMAALLIEAAVTDRVDEVWVVYADRETQLDRLQERDAMSRTEAEQRLAAQMPMDEKKGCGKVVIDNCGSMAELQERVRRVLVAERLGG
jgi:dephospho-CoA kinase